MTYCPHGKATACPECREWANTTAEAYSQYPAAYAELDKKNFELQLRIQQLETLIECGITALENSTPNHPQIEVDAVLDAFKEALLPKEKTS